MTQTIEAAPHANSAALFTKGARDVTGSGPDFINALRHRGLDRFHEVGFPDAKSEEWRFISLAPLTRTSFDPAPVDADVSESVASLHRRYTFTDALAEVVLVNGVFCPRLSRIGKLPRGVVVMSLAEAFDKHPDVVSRHLARHADLDGNPFVALSTGHLRDGALIHLPRGATVEGFIHVLCIGSGGAATSPTKNHPRMLLVADDGAIATVVESYVGDDAATYFTNPVTEFAVADNAVIDHYRLNQESTRAFHVGAMAVHLGKAAQFISHSITLGGRLTRNDLSIKLAGQHADATLNGLVLIGGEQVCDNHTLLEHAAPDCPSHELYKHVLDGKSSCVFKGKIFVHQIAQKTDSKQTSKSLLLTDDATMNSMPALEIYADDVKCTHGSTTGPVDQDMIFYLRSRGVSLDAARHLLTYAFAADITRRIKVDAVRSRVEDVMAARHGLPQDIRITDAASHTEALI